MTKEAGVRREGMKCSVLAQHTVLEVFFWFWKYDSNVTILLRPYVICAGFYVIVRGWNDNKMNSANKERLQDHSRRETLLAYGHLDGLLMSIHDDPPMPSNWWQAISFDHYPSSKLCV